MIAPHHLPNATENVAAVLEHVARYRLTTFAALQRLELLASFSPRQIRYLLRESVQQSLLGSAWLHQGLRYWHLGPQGVGRLELPETAAGPLSEPAKVRACAMLHFCCLSAEVRHRLTTAELVEQFSDLSRSGLPQGYYFDPSGAGRLGFAKIDVGHHGRWDRVLQTVREMISVQVLHAGIRPLIRAGRFEITVLTVLPQKARRLQEALRHCPDAQRIPVQVVALPGLLPLVASLTRKEVAVDRT